jgi:hypothetical protein
MNKISIFSLFQNSFKMVTITTIPKGCQPLPRVKDKDNNSIIINISLFESPNFSLTTRNPEKYKPL